MPIARVVTLFAPCLVAVPRQSAPVSPPPRITTFFPLAEIVDGVRRAKSGSEQIIPADLVLLALGFTGPVADIEINNVRLERAHRGVLNRSENYATNIDGVYVAGDAGRGASLIVWAIAEGRAAAAEIDEFLEGQTILPKPIKPSDRGITV